MIGEFSAPPRWDTWIGRSDKHVAGKLLSNFEDPPLGGLKREFSKFGYMHVMLLLPNPCYERKTDVMEKSCVEALDKLLFS